MGIELQKYPFSLVEIACCGQFDTHGLLTHENLTIDEVAEKNELFDRSFQNIALVRLPFPRDLKTLRPYANQGFGAARHRRRDGAAQVSLRRPDHAQTVAG